MFALGCGIAALPWVLNLIVAQSQPMDVIHDGAGGRWILGMIGMRFALAPRFDGLNRLPLMSAFFLPIVVATILVQGLQKGIFMSAFMLFAIWLLYCLENRLRA